MKDELIDEYSNILVEFYERMSSWENSVVSDRDISLPQMHLIEVVGNNGSIRMKELAQILGVTTGTLTVMVHRLLSKGYVIKKQDSEDKRSSILTLSEKGNEEYENHHHMHGHLIEDIIKVIGQEDSKLFFEQLKKIQDVM